MPVLIEHMQDTTYYTIDDNTGMSERPPREQTAATSLRQSSYVDSVTLRSLIRTAPGKGGGSNTETEATARVWHEGLQKLRLFIYAAIDEDEDDN